tara:strand:- start:2719 stop:3234 length:516 start_codon:yes stop_codon:yes gene_type:complete
MANQYAERDIMGLDKKGGHYSRHLSAMTSEGLHDKSDIAAELAYRDARIAQLEADCAAHKAAEEVQIALREKADEREAALAAHVESLHEALEQALIHWGPYCTEEEGIAYAECMRRLDQVPTISLARRDLIQRAVGLEDALKACESSEFAFSIKGFLYHKANKLRQQAEQC